MADVRGKAEKADGRAERAPAPAGIYERYAQLLRHIATEKFGIPRSEAEALVHDIFVTYLSDPSHVREVRPYLIGAISNASRNYWRSKYYESAVFSAEEPEDTIDPAWVDEVSIRLTVARVLARLKPQCRETLRRFYLNGEKAAEIAGGMETTTGHVFKLLSVCRKDALRACLEATGDEACNI